MNISKGEQFKPDFLAISPNNRIPAIIDHEPVGGGAPISVFESGAILLYLAEKAGRFLPAEPQGRVEVTQWLFWQMAGLGPMAGQNHHFSNYAPEKLPDAINRYVSETNRLYGVLNRRLADRPFIAGTYSIADMAAYPWIVPYKNSGRRVLRGFSAPQALVRDDQEPAGCGARLRQGEGGQRPTHRADRGIQAHPVRPDRQVRGLTGLVAAAGATAAARSPPQACAQKSKSSMLSLV